MATIPIKSKVNLEVNAVLEGIAQLDNDSLEKFAKAVNDLLIKRKAPVLDKKETILLKKINAGIPIETLMRFEALQTILKRGKATKAEKKEFESLVDIIENKEAERLKNMLALAKLWKLTLPQLRKKLGIHSSAPDVQ